MQCCQANGQLSQLLKVIAGIPQGFFRTPFLFLIYLSNSLKKQNVICTQTIPKIEIAVSENKLNQIPSDLSIVFGDFRILRARVIHSLGVMIDEALAWTKHIELMTRKLDVQLVPGFWFQANSLW